MDNRTCESSSPSFRVSCLTGSAGEGSRPFRPQCTIVLAQLDELRDQEMSNVMGLGAHVDAETARQIAVAEATERYAASQVPRADIKYCPLAECEQGIDPRTIQELSPDQARFVYLTPFDESQSYYWTPGRDVIRNLPARIIADLCYYPFRPKQYPQRFAWANSSGMAAGMTQRGAERRALLELFERDALMVVWMAKHSPPRVPDSMLPETVLHKRLAMAGLGYTFVTLDVTCRSVPVAMAIAYRDLWPALVVCMAARFSFREALIAAWDELEVELFWRLREARRSSECHLCLDPQEVMASEDHAMFYNHPHNLQNAAFLWQNTETSGRLVDGCICCPGDEGDFNVVECCQAVGLDTLYEVDYGVLNGLRVIRLLSPNLVPLLFGCNQFPLEHPARRTVRFSGRAGQSWSGTVLPHPLD